MTLEERISELEIKISFQDSLIEELNGVVTDQQNQIDDLKKLLNQIQSKVTDTVTIDPAQVKPPHY